jgi:hypothetical protein
VTGQRELNERCERGTHGDREHYAARLKWLIRDVANAKFAYSKALAKEQFAERLAKQYAAARANKKGAAMGRRPRTHIRKSVMIDGVRTKLERA